MIKNIQLIVMSALFGFGFATFAVSYHFDRINESAIISMGLAAVAILVILLPPQSTNNKDKE